MSVKPGQPEQLALPDLRARPVLRAQPVQRVRPATLGLMVPPDLRVLPVLRDLWGKQAPQVQPVLPQRSQDLRGRKGQWARPVLRGTQVRQVQREK